jgi:endonuclease/exonuclease/phosphatase family metal-dependent hydrolase
LAAHGADVAFVQECRPVSSALLTSPAIIRTVNPRKAIALASVSEAYALEAIAAPMEGDVTAVAATVSGPIDFFALGIWAHPPNYVEDALRAVDVHRDALGAGPAVVLGDLNSGTRLHGGCEPSNGHLRLVSALGDLGLVSAYHAFHGVEHGREQHPTYHHLRRVSEPWHIDFCFIPAVWAEHLVSVIVLDGPDWRAISDHLPLQIELKF